MENKPELKIDKELFKDVEWVRKEDVGANHQTFEIVLNEYFQGYKYFCGFDDYEQEKPLNTYHKIRKFLGLKYKVKEVENHVSMYKLYDNGIVEHLNRKE